MIDHNGTSTSIYWRDEADGFAVKLVFTDEATFQLWSKVNRHNVRYWSRENPHLLLEHAHDSSNVPVFYAVTKV